MYLNFDTVEAFAVKRNPQMSFPFLKENGELLSIARNFGFLIDPRAVELYRDFYDNAYTLVTCYPQYYRFILPMALDLEAAGMNGTQGQMISAYVRQEDLVTYDTSDVRRLDALSMLARLGQLSGREDKIYKGVLARIERLVENPAWYAKFHKPLFYDLTHIIFYLTAYGRRPLPIKADPVPCLINIGLLALLDNDADLLSEVCICLGYLGQDIPAYWDAFLVSYTEKIKVSFSEKVASALNPLVDEYHPYLVCNGYMASRGRRAFKENFQSRTPSFYVAPMPPSCLAQLSNVSHSAHFQRGGLDCDLERLMDTLGEDDFSHWQYSLSSHPRGENLVREFSGLA